MRGSVLLCLLLVSTAAAAKPILTATCGVPTGTRYGYSRAGLQFGKDDFTNVNPVFVLDSEKKGKLLVIFGATQSAQGLGVATQADEAAIVAMSPEKITAVLVTQPNGIVETFSLFPTEGVMFYVKQFYLNRGETSAQIVTMWAKCTFA